MTDGATAVDAGPRKRSDLGAVLAAIGLSTAAAISLGFSRFAYALLLPPMREALHLTYAQAGSLNTANGVGYILGALTCGAAVKRWGLVRAFRAGLIGSAVLLLLTPCTSDLGMLFTLRAAGGLSTAWTFILGATLAAGIAGTDRASFSGFLVAIYVAGASAGIAISGTVVPIALQFGLDGWRAGWLAMGCLSAIGIIPAWCAAAAPAVHSQGNGHLRSRDLIRLVPTVIGYGLFGCGYAGFMTFVIAFLRSDGSSGISVSLFWIVLGVTSTVCTLVWGSLLGRLRGGAGPAIVYSLTLAGTLPLLISVSRPCAYATAIVFGGSVMAGPAAITILARQQLQPSVLSSALAGLTVAFAVGQATGPLISGVISDLSGSVLLGLWTSPALLGVGALIAALQRSAPQAL